MHLIFLEIWHFALDHTLSGYGKKEMRAGLRWQEKQSKP
jgi:hypothetical protein